MAQLPQGCTNNKESSDEKKTFPPIPGGWYKSVIEDSDYAANKDRTGFNLKLVWKIIEGPSKGSKLFEYLCLEHPKTDTMQQAKRTFNKINDVCGFKEGKRVADSSLLHNNPMMIEIECKIGSDFPNSIKKHEAITMNTAPVQTSTHVENTPDIVGDAKAPWEV